MRKPKHFLFDLDGTLIDSIELIASSFRVTFKQHMHDPPPEQQWLETIGQTLHTQFSNFVDDEAKIERMILTYREHNERNHDKMVRGYPGVREAVSSLAGGAGEIGIVTSKIRRMAIRGLEHCGYGGVFETIIGSDDVDQHKPHPAPILKALDELSIAAKETIYIGDSPHDMRSGRAAGVQTGAVLWGPYDKESLAVTEPDRWFGKADDLLELC